MKPLAFIIGLSSTKLTYEEIYFIKNNSIYGIILFKRNINNINQVFCLTNSINYFSKNKNILIIVDQEGGRVNRFSSIIDLHKYNAKYLGGFYNDEFFEKKILYFLNINLNLLKNSGINTNTYPVIDLYNNPSNAIIGDRAFSSNPKIVKTISDFIIKFFKENGIVSVTKHIPGHGSTSVDSHFSLPIVHKTLKELLNSDFDPFKNLNSLMTMTAHILYSKIDNRNCATQSKIIIQDIIRKKLSFKGIIITDDISMKALSGSFKNKIYKSLDAGCNIILHCNGKINEAHELVKIIPEIDSFTQNVTYKVVNIFKKNT